MDYKCLIVDDEKELAESTCEYFNYFDLKTHYVLSYQECLEFFRENSAELILLDINLADQSGFDLCKELRKTMDIPILFISARSSNDDILLALNIGGDDYIQKPYTLSVLLAKVKVVLKRLERMQESRWKEDARDRSVPIQEQDIYVDENAGKVYRRGQEVPFKGMEFKLLHYLVQNKGRIISKEELFAHVWEDVFTGDSTLNVHIRHLREKLENHPNEPIHIKTVWGRGYSYED
ncbi:MAG: DNA-binding response regulator [Herbinix sp.]|jgi:two-component system response regulator RegX3|nr:DNA-binding response regulator [Herbinix sp.]